MEMLGGQRHHASIVGPRSGMGSGGGGEWDSFMGFSERPYSHAAAGRSSTAQADAPLRMFPRTPRAAVSQGRRQSGAACGEEAHDAQSAASLFGPMRHERPPQAATASSAAALHALSNMKHPFLRNTKQVVGVDVEVGRGSAVAEEAVVETVAPTGVRATLTASTVLRFVEQLDKEQPPTETEVVVGSVMTRMVELVSLRCAGEAQEGLPEALDEYQKLCFATEQKGAEEVKVAVKMKKMLSSKKGHGRQPNATLMRAGSQRQRLQQAQAAAAWMKNREQVMTDAGVRLAEEAPASAGCLHRRRPVSSDRAESAEAGKDGGAKRRPRSERGAGGGKSAAMRGLNLPTTPRRHSDTVAFGSSTAAVASDFSYPGFAYPTANLFTLAGCGSDAVQRRVLDVVRKQNETLRAEKGRRRL